MMNVGAGPGGGIGGPGGFPPGAGVFSVPSGKTIKTRVDCVCLDHGKPDPTPRVPYKIVALETVSDRPELAELIASLGKGQTTQRVAQAGAWHLANEMTWEELDAKRIKRITGIQQRWFHPREIEAAKRLVEQLPSVKAKSRQRKSEGDSLADKGQGNFRPGFCPVGMPGFGMSTGRGR
jgi:hypothetical protein